MASAESLGQSSLWVARAIWKSFELQAHLGGTPAAPLSQVGTSLRIPEPWMCCKSRAPRLSQALPCSAGATEVHLKGFFLLRESFGTNWSSGGPGGPRGESQREAGEDKEACMACIAPTAPTADRSAFRTAHPPSGPRAQRRGPAWVARPHGVSEKSVRSWQPSWT